MGLKIDFLFYAEDIFVSKCLKDTEARHCTLVLRKKEGDFIYITDGKGKLFKGQITSIKSKACFLNLEEVEYNNGSSGNSFFIGIAPTKNADRIAYFIEKAVEIGVSGFYFFKSKNTVAKNINLERLEKVAVSAMKQSLSLYKPEITELKPFSNFLKQFDEFDGKFLAHLDVDSVSLMETESFNKTIVLIGPEGDFTEEEIAEAKKSGFKTVRLGNKRLRTETAGIVAASILSIK